jgi:hypothetical protein
MSPRLLTRASFDYVSKWKRFTSKRPCGSRNWPELADQARTRHEGRKNRALLIGYHLSSIAQNKSNKW